MPTWSIFTFKDASAVARDLYAKLRDDGTTYVEAVGLIGPATVGGNDENEAVVTANGELLVDPSSGRFLLANGSGAPSTTVAYTAGDQIGDLIDMGEVPAGSYSATAASLIYTGTLLDATTLLYLYISPTLPSSPGDNSPYVIGLADFASLRASMDVDDPTNLVGSDFTSQTLKPASINGIVGFATGDHLWLGIKGGTGAMSPDGVLFLTVILKTVTVQ